MIRDIKAADIKGLDVYGAFSSCGFQASNVGRAIDIIGKMKEEKATVFLTFTSNLVASGLRGVIAEMCRKKLVDCIITAGGSLDHDLIKSRLGYLEGDFMMDDGALHRKGINRLGNILVPNKCYEYLEGFMQEVYEDIYKEEKARGAAYALASPSQIARRIGQRTGKDSFLHWCAINDIPVFCPGITDSAIGLQTYFYKQKRKDFGIDVTKDMNSLAQLALNADSTGGIVLGGGISKHHAIGVNLLRGGFDYAVYVTTASPWDGSLSGARTNEGISWGKIKEKANHVTVDADATIAFPLIIARYLR